MVDFIPLELQTKTSPFSLKLISVGMFSSQQRKGKWSTDCVSIAACIPIPSTTGKSRMNRRARVCHPRAGEAETSYGRNAQSRSSEVKSYTILWPTGWGSWTTMYKFSKGRLLLYFLMSFNSLFSTPSIKMITTSHYARLHCKNS